MGWIYVKKNKNLWNIWSTIIDEYLEEKDVTLDELEKIALEIKIERLRDDHKETFNEIRKGNKNYFKTKKEL